MKTILITFGVIIALLLAVILYIKKQMKDFPFVFLLLISTVGLKGQTVYKILKMDTLYSSDSITLIKATTTLGCYYITEEPYKINTFTIVHDQGIDVSISNDNTNITITADSTKIKIIDGISISEAGTITINNTKHDTIYGSLVYLDQYDDVVVAKNAMVINEYYYVGIEKIDIKSVLLFRPYPEGKYRKIENRKPLLTIISRYD